MDSKLCGKKQGLIFSTEVKLLGSGHKATVLFLNFGKSIITVLFSDWQARAGNGCGQGQRHVAVPVLRGVAHAQRTAAPVHLPPEHSAHHITTSPLQTGLWPFQPCNSDVRPL